MCKTCSQSFSSKDDLQRHDIAEHNVKLVKEYLLTIQSKLFNNIDEQKIYIFSKVLTLKNEGDV